MRQLLPQHCGEVLGERWRTKCCIFHTKCAAKLGQVSSPKRRVPDDAFMLGSGSDHARVVYLEPAMISHPPINIAPATEDGADD